MAALGGRGHARTAHPARASLNALAALHIGIPAYRERDWLPHTLASLAAQNDSGFVVWVCVNQPAEDFCDPSKREATGENLDLLAWLAQRRHDFPFKLIVLDAVRPGQAPPAKVAGVGWARRHIFERVSESGSPDDLCISLDADTTVEPRYTESVRQAFARHANAVALAAPYYHPLPEEPALALALLRYECFLRYYQLHLWRIGSPYAFLPIGSAMAFTLRAYRRIHGFPLRRAGEDFYFLQQMRKLGPVIRWIDARVFPAPRPSSRAPFGTGPLMAEPDLTVQEARFPFYGLHGFDLLGETFHAFRELHKGPVRLPIQDFVEAQMGGCGVFDRMRRNFGDCGRFVKACHEKLDALRYLQFLRFHRERSGPEPTPSENLQALLSSIGKPVRGIRFELDHLDELAQTRDLLFLYESELQQRFMDRWDHRAQW